METLYRLLGRLIERVGQRALTGFGLLTLLVGVAAIGVGALTRLENEFWLVFNALLAVGCGWVAARARLRGASAVLGLTGLGLAAVALTAGGLAGNLVTLARAGLGWLAQALSPPAGWPAGGPLTLAARALAGQSAGLLRGVLNWLTGLITGDLQNDPLSAGLVWALLLWGVAAWAAWWVRRHAAPLAGGLPVVALLALSLGYTRASTNLLFLALAALLGLLAWNRYDQRERGWLRQGIDLAEDIPFDVTVWALIISLGLAGVAATAARPSPQRLLTFTRVLLQTRSPAVERLGEALGLTPPRSTPPPATSGLPEALPRAHLLGGALEWSRQPALTVRLEQPAPTNGVPSPEALTPALPYLRAVTYDVYTGRGWASSPTTPQDYPAGVALPIAATPGWPVTLTLQPADAARRQVYAPGELLAVSLPVRVDWRAPPDAFAAALTTAWPASGYQVTAWLTPTSEPALHESGANYPPEIASRYLQLPADLPPRVAAQAAELAAQGATAYDRARAIEAHLRGYAYSLDLPTPPADRDLVDYFLFDLQTGYCDYTASAMVVLARLTGIPARLAIGYALPASAGPAGLQPGDATAGPTGSVWFRGPWEIRITEDYAHSWPELYFPGTGWVAFEPTGGRQPRPLPAAPAIQSDAPPIPLAGQPLGPVSTPPSPYSRLWAGALAGLTLVAGLWIGLDRLRWRGSAGLRRMFVGLRRRAAGLGVRVYPGLTPAELADALAQRVPTPAPGRRGPPAAATAAAIQRLAALYARLVYSPEPPTPQELAAARRSWLGLRWRLWQLRWQVILRKIRKPTA